MGIIPRRRGKVKGGKAKNIRAGPVREDCSRQGCASRLPDMDKVTRLTFCKLRGDYPRNLQMCPQKASYNQDIASTAGQFCTRPDHVTCTIGEAL